MHITAKGVQKCTQIQAPAENTKSHIPIYNKDGVKMQLVFEKYNKTEPGRFPRTNQDKNKPIIPSEDTPKIMDLF